tara:strand:- start:4478 stop:5407 length:930 start_codon:yes stop_codon:yes gene_type:complete
MAFDVSTLADFNNETAGELFVRSIMEGSTIEYATVKEGIKYKEPINLFEVDLQIADGRGCVTTSAGTASFEQRDIEVCQRSSMDGLCLRDLDTKYIGVMQPEGSYNESFTLVQEYSEQITAGFQKSNDQFIWAASAASSGNCVDGLREIISGSTTGVVVPASGLATPTSANIGDQVDLLLENLDADVQDRDDLTVFMSITNFRKYITWLRNENNYYFDMNSVENRKNLMAMKHPFTPNVTVVGTIGLQGSNRIVLGPAKQIVVGTDLLSDVDNFQLWYSIDDDKLKHRLVSKLGVNVAYPIFWVSNDIA